MIKTIITSTLLALSLNAITIEEVHKSVSIEGKDGGLIANEGAAWQSSSLKDKVLVIFYVDSDEKDTKLLFYKSGKMSADDMAEAFKLIEANI